MAILIQGKTICPLCRTPLDGARPMVGFPTFLPSGHALARFSDHVFHRTCFDADPQAPEVSQLYERYRRAIDERPRTIKTLDAAERWQRNAIASLWAEPGFGST